MANQTVAAVYDRYEDAERAVSQLEAAGVAHSDISIVAKDGRQRSGDTAGTTPTGDAAANGAGTGATVGTVVGAGAGVLAGLGMLAIPGLGPIVAAGWLVSTLVGAGAGAAAGGLLGSLTGAGVSETDAHTYTEAVNRGGTLVTVRANETNHDRVVSILDTDGAVDMNQREATWRSDGWTGQYAGTTDAARADSMPSGMASPSGASIANPLGTGLGQDSVAGSSLTGDANRRPRVRSYP